MVRLRLRYIASTILAIPLSKEERIMQPAAATLEEIGRLCAAWSYLEGRTEQLVWGLLNLKPEAGRKLTWELDMKRRWALVTKHAAKKHSLPDIEMLKQYNKDAATIAQDRNIIVHGLMHAAAISRIPGKTADLSTEEVEYVRVPCWTVFRGGDAGKNYPVSANAVKLVRENIQRLGKKVTEFNFRFNYLGTSDHNKEIEEGWPAPIF